MTEVCKVRYWLLESLLLNQPYRNLLGPAAGRSSVVLETLKATRPAPLAGSHGSGRGVGPGRARPGQAALQAAPGGQAPHISSINKSRRAASRSRQTDCEPGVCLRGCVGGGKRPGKELTHTTQTHIHGQEQNNPLAEIIFKII